MRVAESKLQWVWRNANLVDIPDLALQDQPERDSHSTLGTTDGYWGCNVYQMHDMYIFLLQCVSARYLHLYLVI